MWQIVIIMTEELPELEENEEDDALFEHYKYIADAGQTPLRIDKFLVMKSKNIARNKIQKSIEYGFILVNQQPTKANYKVKPHDVVTVSFPIPPRDYEVLPEEMPLDIVYEDDYLLVINKPAGLVVHPAHGNWTGTLLNGLVHHFRQMPANADGRPGLVHRIDKDTSGLLVVAKHEETLTKLAKQFFDHTTERTYYALVWGEPKEEQGTIRVNLGRSPKDRRITEAIPDGERGKDAITHYKILQRFYYVTLVQCNLETGRTHQIRAHMKYLGHPLFNDEMYGGNKVLRGTVFSKYKSFVENCFQLLPRQALHAKSLGFTHPMTGEWLQFEVPLPPDFQQALDKWAHYHKYDTSEK